MTFTFKLSKRLALTFAAVGGLLWGCADVPSGSTSTPIVVEPLAALGDTLFADGFESGTLAWDDNSRPQAQAIVADAARTGSRGLRVTYQRGSDGGAISKFITRSDRVYLRAAVRFPANWTGDTKLWLLRAAPAANPWASFGISGLCPSGANWAVTNAATIVPNLDLRFYTYFVGMRTDSNGQCWGRYGFAGDGGVATYTAPLAVSKGSWHLVELEAQMNTVGQADGWQKMWLDGAITGEWNGLTFRTSSALQWNAVTLELWSGTITQTQALDIDDVLVLGSKPGSASPPPPPTLAQVILTPDTATVSAGTTRQFTATGRLSDSSTAPVNAAFAATGGTISTSGLYTAGATAGTFRVIASVGGKADTSTVTVRQPVATVQVVPASASIVIAGSIQLQVTLRDAAGQVLAGRPVSWTTSNAAIAATNGTGNVTGVVVGTATILATSEGKSGTSAITVAALPAPPPGTDNLVADDFEGTLAKWEDVTGVRLSTTRARGRQSLEFPYAAGGTGGGAWRKQLVSDVTASSSLYLRWWSYYPTGFRWPTGDVKVALLEALSPRTAWSQTAPWKVYLKVGPNGLLLPERFIWDGTSQASGNWLGLPLNVRNRPYTTGVWTCTEVQVTTNTVGQSNGAFRVWVNDTLSAEHLNVKYRDTPISWNALFLNGYYGGGSPVAQSWYLDDLQTSRSRIGCGPLPVPPPPSPPPPTTPPPPPTTPPSGALLFEDFSTYSSTSQFLSDPRGIYSDGEDSNTGNMALDASVTLDGHPTLRYDYRSPGCNSMTVRRNLTLPQAQAELWIDMMVRFSSNFTTVASGCSTPPAFKLFFGRVLNNAGRWGVHWAEYGSAINWEYPTSSGGSGDRPGPGIARNYHDGQWHRMRLHWKHGSPGVWEMWMDGTKIISEAPSTSGASSIYGLSLGVNLDQGISSGTMSLWWGRVSVLRNNPGW